MKFAAFRASQPFSCDRDSGLEGCPFDRLGFGRIDELAVRNDPVDVALAKREPVRPEGRAIGAQGLLRGLVPDIVVAQRRDRVEWRGSTCSRCAETRRSGRHGQPG